MADEATPQETTTEQVVTEPAVTGKVDDTTDIGADVQGTETETTDTDPSKDADKPAEKTYDEKYVQKLRDEAAANRVKGNEKAALAAKDAAEKAQKELAEQIGKALGLIKDDTPTDPAELLKQAEEQKAQIARERDENAEKLRNYARKDALTVAADKAAGDLASILDSRSVNAEIEALDTTADDFAAQVEAIVSAAVESNPKLKKTADRVSAPRSGGDLSNGNAAPKPNAPKSVEDMIRERRERRQRERS
jgi:hypothetical protein